MDTVGARIKYFRDNHVPLLTQEALSLEAGIKMGTLSNYETNKRNPSRKAFKKMAAVFNVDWRILDPLETPKFTPSSNNKPTDCEHICERLTAFERNLLKRYADITDNDREKVYEEFKKLVADMEKKSGGRAVPMDHDKHQAV